ncbi:MAG: hypothetical protein MUF31_08115 [Akkermansiaceae bacterium]|nr:hypothetical protein [Akkermansiaceae bacterium]
MKTTPNTRNKQPRGYISYVAVVALGMTLLAMVIQTYRAASASQSAQSSASLRVDYSSKEDAVLRAIIPIASNRAMQAMQNGSNASATSRAPMTWQNIFLQAVQQSNASNSVDSAVLSTFNLGNAVLGNQGDATLSETTTFRAYQGTSGFASAGLNLDFGSGFPAPLQTTNTTVSTRDNLYPIITSQKIYGSLASTRVGAPVATYPQFNLIPYPNIRFGYAKPGEQFVAKRNWWAFRMNLSSHSSATTKVTKRERDFILSIYEVPSQLAISAEAFTVIGEYADGTEWENANIEGGVFASRARVGSGAELDWVSGRSSVELAADAEIGEEPLVANGGANAVNPFAPGVREQYEITHGEYMPVSMASESGRAAFIPINRGADFFDRFSSPTETNTLSTTTWNDYTVGARQCAMTLDISDAVSASDRTPRVLTFSYLRNGVRQTMTLNQTQGAEAGLPPGFIQCCNENQSFFFGAPVDVAYGKNGTYYYQYGVSGTINFNNARFGDPLVGTFKAGFYRPSFPFRVTRLHDTKHCIEIFPQRVANFLTQIGGDSPAVNHSIAVNVNYPASAFLQKPSIPCTDLDYGVILRECADLSSFTRGFSMVTNLRLYIADDFNTTAVTPPTGSGLPTPFYPPCSLFAPEKRYGAEYDPYKLRISGQMGSLAGGNSGEEVHLLDMKTSREADVSHDQVEVNLSPIKHPAALPPITMMNWLVVLEERRREYYEGNAATTANN